MLSVMKLVFDGQRRGISFCVDCIYFESLIARARNAAAASFLNLTECDYMLFIDSDIAFDSEDVFKLLKSDKDVCTDFATEISYSQQVKEIEEVKYAATGFMLFKKCVFNQIIRTVPNIKYQNDIDGYSSYGDNFYDFFPCKVNPETKKYESEDYGFCNLYRSIGGKIYVNTTCNLTHYGWKGYQGNFYEQNKVWWS